MQLPNGDWSRLDEALNSASLTDSQNNTVFLSLDGNDNSELVSDCSSPECNDRLITKLQELALNPKLAGYSFISFPMLFLDFEEAVYSGDMTSSLEGGAQMFKRATSGTDNNLVIMIILLAIVAIILVGGLLALISYRSRRAEAHDEEEVIDVAPARRWWQFLSMKKSSDEINERQEEELRKAVRSMMMANNVPIGTKKVESYVMRDNTGYKRRLDAKSATETFAVQGAQTDGFSQFINFTSSRFQTESGTGGVSGKNNGEDDSYLF